MNFPVFLHRAGKPVILACVCLFLWTVSARAADDSETLYKSKCVACHGADGAGSAVGIKLGSHDLRTPEVQKMSDEELAAVISKGKNKMPSYEKTLKPDQIKGLVTFTRSLAKK
jgi:mono/diheme cytochrome c family protein